MPLTAKVLERCGTPPDKAREYLPLLTAAMREHGVTTQSRAAMFLAQLQHESMRLTRFEEIASGADYEGNRALGNVRPGDGVRFKGRGPIQLTGRWNYGHYGKLIGVDLISRPERAAQPRWGFRLAAAYFEDRGCNDAADRGDFLGVTRRINAAALHLEERRRLYGILKDLDCTPGAPFIARGDTGDAVETLTRRLSFVRSRVSGKPYLDGTRRRFDARTEAGLRAFQQEHDLKVDGRFGPRTAKALRRATEREKARRLRRRDEKVKRPAEAPDRRVPRRAGEASRLPALVEELQRHEAAADRSWERIVTYGHRRRAVLGRLQARDGSETPSIAKELDALKAILNGILSVDARVGTLVEYQRQEAAVAPGGPATGEGASAAPAQTPGNGSEAGVTFGPFSEGAGAPPGDGRSGAGTQARGRSGLSEDELLERIERLDRAAARARRTLIARYAAVDKDVLALAPPKRRRPDGRRDGGGGSRRPGPVPAPVRRPPALRPEEVRGLQEDLNRFFERHVKEDGPLIVDGVRGPATRKAIRRARYLLGYTGTDLKSAKVDPELRRRLRNPRSTRVSPPAMLARGASRRRKERLAAKKAAKATGVATFDGKPVVAWVVPHLEWARANGWGGKINSGYRTPEYSEQLCKGMCGAPSCPGKCAGRTSKHSGKGLGAGAIDVSDYVTFGRLMKRCPHKPRIFNDLPIDPVHFSTNGH